MNVVVTYFVYFKDERLYNNHIPTLINNTTKPLLDERIFKLKFNILIKYS